MINDLIDDGEIQGIVEDTLTRANDHSFIAQVAKQGFSITNAGLKALADEGYKVSVFRDMIDFTWDKEQDI